VYVFEHDRSGAGPAVFSMPSVTASRVVSLVAACWTHGLLDRPPGMDVSRSSPPESPGDDRTFVRLLPLEPRQFRTFFLITSL
jgi:hypothetical protein